MTDIQRTVEEYLLQKEEDAKAIETLKKDRKAWQNSYQKLQKEKLQLEEQNAALLHNAEQDRALIDGQWRELHALRSQLDTAKTDLETTTKRASLLLEGLRDACSMAKLSQNARLLTPTESEELVILTGLAETS